MRRHLVLALGAVAMVAGTAATTAPGASGQASRPVAAAAAPVRLLTCTSTAVVRPVSFVITCADGIDRLSGTRWRRWTTSVAAGTTRFDTESCTPSCAAGKPESYPGTVTLSVPVATKRYGRLFSRLVVRYTVANKPEVYRFSWAGTPAFS